MSLAKVIGPEIEELIREGSPDLAKAVADLHPADLAELLEDLPREDRLVLFEALPPEQGAAVLSELKGETLRLGPVTITSPLVLLMLSSNCE